MNEIVLSRPSPERRSASDNICVELLKEARLGAKNEVLLRDMKIKGTLCLIDLTGEISGGTGREHVDTISLDGTQANSTVLRWKELASESRWHAVNFKTPYMLINLESQPRQHFIDSLEVGFIAFVRRDANEPSAEQSDENVDKFLCDVTPAPENAMSAGSRPFTDGWSSSSRDRPTGHAAPNHSPRLSSASRNRAPRPRTSKSSSASTNSQKCAPHPRCRRS